MRNIHRETIVVIIFCLYMLMQAGCLVGPDYNPQDPNAPAGWVGTKNTASSDAMLLEWWTEFNDTNLTSLIERAMKSNLDLRLAEERIREARAASSVVNAGFWPTANITGSATRNRIGIPNVRKSNLFQAGLDAAWELDIFGGTRRSIEAAEADVKATIEDRRDVLVTLVSELAINYVQLRGYQQEIIIARNNLSSQQQNASVVRKRYEGGFVSALDVANADAQMATTMSQIPVLEISVQQTIYNISVLLGQEPASLLEELSPASSIPLTPPEVPAGLPSEMLRRRPDIRRTEAQIHSATAQIGVATADLFPKFNLAGSINMSASKPGDLRWDQRSWSFGPSASWEIFNAGRVSYNIEIQKALQQQAVLTYKKSVLTAIQDVENALIAYAKEQEHHKALINAVTANRKAVDLATQLYVEGQTDFISVLDAQRSLYVTEDALVRSTSTLSTDLIAIYKALGGGWDSNSPDSGLVP
jgi:NodT family efflux transporter outer membrane factor (OMF) lipoprotein